MAGKRVDISFDYEDGVELDEVQSLLRELRRAGAEGRVLAEHAPGKGMLDVGAVVALVGVSTASAASMAVVSAFLYRVFHKGVILDLRGPNPIIKKSDELAKGTLLILKADSSEYHEGIGGGAVGELMKNAIGGR